MTTNMADAVRRIETFIQRLHDSDYRMKPEAGEITFSAKGNRSKEVETLADGLAKAMRAYDFHKNDEESFRREAFVSSCLFWVDSAFTWGVVENGEGLPRKLRECQEKSAELERNLEIVSTEYQVLKAKYDGLRGHVHPLHERSDSDEHE